MGGRDIDIEKFFDRVNHDMLIARVARKVTDKRVLKLVRSYLNAGVMRDGVVVRKHEGTPQGSICKALHIEPYSKKVIMPSKL